jgi:hypothetical protein
MTTHDATLDAQAAPASCALTLCVGAVHAPLTVYSIALLRFSAFTLCLPTQQVWTVMQAGNYTAV